MAFLDDANRAIVLRIVYAGPPMSGKTATLHALSRHLLGTRYSESVFTPEEADGRTLFFDWLEYSAGLFQGRRIRCQIVSVPGQSALAGRRRVLLESADAVVYVVDAHLDQMREILKFYRELQGFLARPENEPPVGVIVQANKADLPHALSNAHIKKLLDDNPNLAVIATTATTGVGVREAFVQAVGLGLARVRELLDTGKLQPGDADIESGKDLLRQLRALEDREFGRLEDRAAHGRSIVESADTGPQRPALEQLGALLERDLGAGTHNGHRVAAPVAVNADAAPGPPLLPDAGIGAGLVWPAIGGRIVLHELARAQPSVPRQLPDGAWTTELAEGWSLLSLPEHRFADEAGAREEILRLARVHAGFGALLSEHRCITCAATGAGDWRIWQIVRRENTLQHVVRLSLELASPEAIAAELLQVGRLLCTAVESFRAAGFPRAATLGSLGISHGNPVYAGFVMTAAAHAAPAAHDSGASLRNEFRDTVNTLAARLELMPRLLRQLEAGKRSASGGDHVAETLISMFLHAA